MPVLDEMDRQGSPCLGAYVFNNDYLKFALGTLHRFGHSLEHESNALAIFVFCVCKTFVNMSRIDRIGREIGLTKLVNHQKRRHISLSGV